MFFDIWGNYSAVSKRVPRIKGYLVMLAKILTKMAKILAKIFAKILAKIWARYPSSPGPLLDTTDSASLSPPTPRHYRRVGVYTGNTAPPRHMLIIREYVADL